MICEPKPKERKGSKMHLSMVLILFLLGSSLANAQLPTATILGVVKDTSGAVVPEVTLTARSVATGQTRSAVAGGDGSYRFSALPVGNYEIRVEHPGFQTAVRTGLTLTVAQEAVVNFTLEVGAVEQTVAVTAEAPLVNTTSGSLGGLVDAQRVADMPLNGRNYIGLALLQTGVSVDRRQGGLAGMSGTWFSSNGAPLRSNNYLLDGASMVTIHGLSSSSSANTTLGLDGIQEFRVVTNSFSAEYGMTMGSQMVIVSKSGTNTFHGSAFEYLRNGALDARNFFDRKTAASNRRLPAFARNNFGGSFGGPLKKDRTFFFGVYEGLKERLGVTTVSNVIPASAKVDGGLVPEIAPVVKPSLAIFPDPNLPNNQFTFPFTQPTDEHYGQMRVDQMFSSEDTLFGRYTVDDTARITPGAYPQIKNILGSRGQFGTLSETHIFSPRLLNTFRFSYSRTVITGDSPTGVSGPQVSFVGGKEIGQLDIGGITSFGADANNPFHSKQNIFTWSDDLFYTRGRHSLKFGTLINRYQQYVLASTYERGRVTFANLSQFLLARPTSYRAVTPNSILDRTHHYTTLGFYVQDDLRLGSHLTFNLGLRYEFMTQMRESRGIEAALRDIQHDADTTLGPPIRNPSLRNLSPRFGFAWDVMGGGTTAVRGGFALVYDIANLASSSLFLNTGTPPFSGLDAIANPPILTLPIEFPPGAAGKALGGLDYNMQQPHMLQYNLTLERQLPIDMGLTLAYAGSRGINLLQFKEGNPTVPQVLPDGRQFWAGNEPRTNPNWRSIRLITAAGNSWYNSFQFGLTKRLSKGLQFQSSYTWSKLIDETQGILPADVGPAPTDPTHRTVDRGLATFDVAHNWRFNAIYRLPELLSTEGVLAKVVNGWWMSGILALQSGYPFEPLVSSNRSRSNVDDGGRPDRPDRVPGRSNDSIILGGPDRYFDPTAFAIPPAGFLGNSGRGILRGPGTATLDFSVVKDTRLRFLGENGKLEFRAEFFNILNRVNFGMPSAAVYSGTRDVEPPIANAGRITSAATSRQIQLALKILF